MSALDELLLDRYREIVGSTNEIPSKPSPPGKETLIERALEYAETIKRERESDCDSSETYLIDHGKIPAETVTNHHFDGTPTEAIDSDQDSPNDQDLGANVEPDADLEFQIHQDIEADQRIDDQPLVNESTSNEESEEDQEPMKDTFKAEWEVDRFLWPAICGDVEDHLEAELSSAVESIQDECERQLCNVVAIANAEPNGGGTTMTLCLAREAARQGLRVALVDLNHDRPSLMDRLGIACEHGIESLQLEDIGPENICVNAVEDGVSLIPLLQPIDLQYCSGQSVQLLIDRLAASHELVLIDASPEAVEAMDQAEHCEGFGLIRVSKSHPPLADEKESNATESSNVWPMGVIRNFAA